MSNDFKPALIVVDLQEDFCPPNGSLAVAQGRDIVPSINQLLSLPFVLKVATKDWHPAHHISFAANHPGKEAFVDSVEIVNPYNASERYTSRLWPVHCVQGTPGAELIPELDTDKIDAVIEKGTDARVEMYSPFYAPLSLGAPASTEQKEEDGNGRVGDSGLLALLRSHAVTDVYVVGLAGDYCVKSCAEDAAREGFRTYLIEECTRAVDSDKTSWEACKRQMEDAGAKIVGLHGPEVRRLGVVG